MNFPIYHDYVSYVLSIMFKFHPATRFFRLWKLMSGMLLDVHNAMIGSINLIVIDYNSGDFDGFSSDDFDGEKRSRPTKKFVETKYQALLHADDG